MRDLLNFCLKCGEYVKTKKYGATWTDDKNKFQATFGKAFLKLAIKFLLVFFCFSFDDLLFR